MRGATGCAGVAAVLGALWLGGCSSGSSQVEIASGTFVGPTLTWSRTDRTHIAVFTAPAMGWSVELDTARDGSPEHQAFVTLRSPGPDAAAAELLLSVDTRVVLTVPVAVYARIAGQNTTPGGLPYRLVGTRPAELTPEPPPPWADPTPPGPSLRRAPTGMTP